MSARLSPCPYCTTLANGRLFGPRHPCFTVYDDDRKAREEQADGR